MSDFERDAAWRIREEMESFTMGGWLQQLDFMNPMARNVYERMYPRGLRRLTVDKLLERVRRFKEGLELLRVRTTEDLDDDTDEDDGAPVTE